MRGAERRHLVLASDLKAFGLDPSLQLSPTRGERAR
jgi:hypothetical protein